MVSWDMKKHKHVCWPTDVWNIKHFLKRATRKRVLEKNKFQLKKKVKRMFCKNSRIWKSSFKIKSGLEGTVEGEMGGNDGAGSVRKASMAVGRTMRVQKEFLALRPHYIQF